MRRMYSRLACLHLILLQSAPAVDSTKTNRVAHIRPITQPYQIAATQRLPGLVSHPLLAFKGLLPGLLIRPVSADPNQTPVLHWRGIASVFQNNSQPTIWVDGLPTLSIDDHTAGDWDTLTLHKNALVPGQFGAGAGLGVLSIQTKRARWGANGRAIRGLQVRATGGAAQPVALALLNTDEFREVAKRNLKVFKDDPLMPDQGANTDWLGEILRQPVVGQVGVGRSISVIMRRSII